MTPHDKARLTQIRADSGCPGPTECKSPSGHPIGEGDKAFLFELIDQLLGERELLSCQLANALYDYKEYEATCDRSCRDDLPQYWMDKETAQAILDKTIGASHE